MKRVLSSIKCNTATARKLGEADGRALYKTRTKKFFFADGHDLRVASTAEAHSWLSTHFGQKSADAAIAEESSRRVTIDLPAALVEKIDAARDDCNRTRKAVIEAAVKSVFERE